MTYNPKIKYTNVTQEDILQELIKRIPLITDRWTDFNPSDIGISLLDLYSGVAVHELFYLDKKAQDLYLPTVRTRESLFNLARLVGYQIKSRVAAMTTLRFSVQASPTTVTIPKWTRCSTNIAGSSKAFITVNSGIISPGEYYTEVEAWQGAKVENIFLSNGQAGQSFVLLSSQSGNPPSTRVAYGKIEVYVDGVLWDEEHDFAVSSNSSKAYVVQTNFDNTVTVLFGDGFNGYIPPSGASIKIIFIETEGETGNVGKGYITKIDDPIYNSLGALISCQVTNVVEASGGKNEETVYHAKKMIPPSVRRNARSVSEEDFIFSAENFPGIQQARVVDITDYPADDFTLDYYQIRIVVIPYQGYYVSQGVKRNLYDYLTTGEGSKYVTADIDIVDPEYLDIDVSCRVNYKKSYLPDDVRTMINNLIIGFFSPSETPYHERVLTGEVFGQYIGEDVDFIELISQINDLEPVNAVTQLTFSCLKGEYGLNREQQNVPVDRYEMPRLRNLAIVLE
jgi:hypothetical protein